MLNLLFALAVALAYCAMLVGCFHLLYGRWRPDEPAKPASGEAGRQRRGGAGLGAQPEDRK